MTQMICTNPMLCCTAEDCWQEPAENRLLRLLRGAANALRSILFDWQTGTRSHESIGALNRQQLRDIGMEGEQTRRERERSARENYPWHLPLL